MNFINTKGNTMNDLIEKLKADLDKKQKAYEKACASREKKLDNLKDLIIALKNLQIENTKLKNELKKLKSKKG